MPPSASRAIVLPTAFTMASVSYPRRFASRRAPSVSAVSPDWLRTKISVRSSSGGVAVAELARVFNLDRQVG